MMTSVVVLKNMNYINYYVQHMSPKVIEINTQNLLENFEQHQITKRLHF